MGLGGRKCVCVAMTWPGGEWFSRQIMAGIDEAAEALGCEVLALALRFARDPEASSDEAGLLAGEYLGSELFDGLLVVDGQDWLRRHPELGRGKPIVSIAQELEGGPAFTVDNRPGFSSLLDHLFSHHGYRNPVFVSGPLDIPDGKARRDLFLSAIAERGIPGGEERIHYGKFMRDDGIVAVERFIGSGTRPDVFVCANDYMALGVYEGLAKRGLRVPEDAAVTGFDDLRIFRHYEGPLTTVHQPIRELGRRAMEALGAVLEGGPPGAGVEFLSTEAVIRASCGCEPGIEGWVRRADPDVALLGRLAAVKAGDRDRARAAERLAEYLLQSEAIESQALRDLDLAIDQRISAFCQAYIEDWRLDGHPFEERVLLESIGVEDFYLTVYEGAYPGPGGRARLLLAWSGGKRCALPEGGLAFEAREILPASFLAGRRRTLQALGLADHDGRFGLCLTSMGSKGSDSFDKLGRRLTESMRAVRSARDFKELSEKLKATSAKLEELSLSDELTGLYNRRGFLTFAAQQITYCRRQRQAFSILYMDLDGLKEINDTWGHGAGDDAIRAMAELLMKAFRSSDIVSRLGGDEFCVLAPNTANRRADSILERLGYQLRSFNAEGSRPWRLSLSLGEYHSDPADTSPIEAMMREADARLYANKKGKRALSPPAP